jgi:hypothetical protein
MSHEMSKAHQNQVAEKAAIIANTAFGLGRTAERNKILELLEKEVFCECEAPIGHAINQITGEETTNDGSN